ncbi:MAG TPA: HK97 family phage prohead protease [Actinophytocola sp.]|uniref:HK97 family phage prohead protease n=1 Tax=Actinophytocola sp. TaxID=1872138 RepID=UPI002DDD7ECA|nr:HK97 family phage prohead protease [Actinophytocola sp.]HEV2778479.1 HK97 family phage prohead protease [Actinophytocola sp.]
MKTKADRGKLSGASERRSYHATFEVRAAQDGTGGTRYELEGYASVYDEPYRMWDWYGEYDEVVRAGAGTKTLSENPDVVLVFNHAGMPLARTKATSLELSEDTTGLHMRAPRLNAERDVVRAVIQAVEEEILDEMSFRFRVMRQMWSPDYDQRDILEYNIHRGDVSVVTYGANPATSVESALRAQDFDQLPDDAVRALYERLGRRLAQPTSQRHPLSLYRDLAADDDADFRAAVGQV